MKANTPELTVPKDLAQAHRALFEDLRMLEQAVQPASADGLPELRARLGATRGHVAEHFRFEEENGYMDAVTKREPRLERTVQELAQEHRDLGQSLETLCGQAGQAPSLNDELRAAVRDWIKCIRQHENRENVVVQDAFGLDISAED